MWKRAHFIYSPVDGHWIVAIFFFYAKNKTVKKLCIFLYLFLAHSYNVSVYHKDSVLYPSRVDFCVCYDIRIWFHFLYSYGTNFSSFNSKQSFLSLWSAMPSLRMSGFLRAWDPLLCRSFIIFFYFIFLPIHTLMPHCSNYYSFIVSLLIWKVLSFPYSSTDVSWLFWVLCYSM